MRSQRGALSGVAKGLLILAAVAVGGIVVTSLLLWNICLQNFGPGKAAKLAKEIALINDPLPAGWKYYGGSETHGNKLAVLKDEAHGADFSIAQDRNYRSITSKQRAIEAKALNKNWTDIAEGEQLVGGQHGYFVRQAAPRDSAGTVASGAAVPSVIQTSYFNLPDGKVIGIICRQNGITGAPFLQQFKPMLDSIKSFKVAPTKTAYYAVKELKAGVPVTKNDVAEVPLELRLISDQGVMGDLNAFIGKKPIMTIQPGRLICECEFKELTSPVTPFTGDKDATTLVKAVVATRAVEEGELIAAKDLQEKMIPSKDMLKGGLSSKGEVLGWLATYSLEDGGVILKEDFRGINEAPKATDSDDEEKDEDEEKDADK